jgi:hypothetical protein
LELKRKHHEMDGGKQHKLIENSSATCITIQKKGIQIKRNLKHAAKAKSPMS